jgi:hypothetical protein
LLSEEWQYVKVAKDLNRDRKIKLLLSAVLVHLRWFKCSRVCIAAVLIDELSCGDNMTPESARNFSSVTKKLTEFWLAKYAGQLENLLQYQLTPAQWVDLQLRHVGSWLGTDHPSYNLVKKKLVLHPC